MTSTTGDACDVVAEVPVVLWHNQVPVTSIAQSDQSGELVGALVPLPPATPPAQHVWGALTHQLAATLPLLGVPRLPEGEFGVTVLSTPQIGEAFILTRIPEGKDGQTPVIPNPHHGYVRVQTAPDGYRLECCDATGVAISWSTISEHGELSGPIPAA